jgi:hypothetical protein
MTDCPQAKSKSKLFCDQWSVSQCVLVSRTHLESKTSPIQSCKLLLALTSTIIPGFGPWWGPWPYFVLFRLLHILKWDPLFKERRGLTTAGHSPLCWGVTADAHFHSVTHARVEDRIVSLSFLVSSPIWGSWLDISYSLTVTVLFFGGRPLWREDGFVVCQSAVICRLSLCTTILHFTCLTWY